MCFNLRGADSLARGDGSDMLEQDFELALAAIPSGYGEGVYERLAVRRHPAQVTRRKADQPVRASARGATTSSAHLNRLRSGEDSLRPCEMPAEKVVAFVLGYAPDPPRVCQGCVV